MVYLGSKRRLAPEILPIMLAERGSRVWVEPFVGGGNMIAAVHGCRIGADANKWAIEALVAIRDSAHLLAKNNSEFTEADYAELHKSDNYKFKGFAGFAYSYGGCWRRGWRRDSRGRDYVAETYRSAQKQSPKLKGVELIHSDYKNLQIPPNSFIYCDPPYQNTTKYTSEIDHGHFWQWRRDKFAEGHLVYISEYSAPDDFVCVWSKNIDKPMRSTSADVKCTAEKLFTIL